MENWLIAHENRTGKFITNFKRDFDLRGSEISYFMQFNFYKKLGKMNCLLETENP